MASSGGTTEPAAVSSSADAVRKQASNPWKEGWRSLFLLGAAVVLAVLGYTFWLASAIGQEDASLEAKCSSGARGLSDRSCGDSSPDHTGVLA